MADILSARIQGTLVEATSLQSIIHPGLRGRLREILVANLIRPLVAPTCGVFHGTVEDSLGKRFDRGPESDGRKKTEDDIVIVDTECLPPIMYCHTDAVLPIESAIARIEVKSQITATHLADATLGAQQFAELMMQLPPDGALVQNDTVQVVFGFESDLKSPPENEYRRMLEIFRDRGIDSQRPPFQFLCIAGRGLWTYRCPPGSDKEEWMECPADLQHSEVLYLLAQLLDILPSIREKRKGATLGSYIYCADQKRASIHPRGSGDAD
jgi:hypothetical protein